MRWRTIASWKFPRAGLQIARMLAGALPRDCRLALDKPVVYALARGGVPVAVEIARHLGTPLDFHGSQDRRAGCARSGARPQTVVNQKVRKRSGVHDTYLERARALNLRELERR
jgi:predicted phosphoribosyltransferase